MARSRGKWEYRGHWIDNNVKGSDSFYAYWYEDDRARRTGSQSRKSLKTAALDDAKDRLVAFVLEKQTEQEDALVLSVIAKYYNDVASKLPSRHQAKRTKALFKEVLEGPERVSDLTEKFQVEKIMRKWLETHGHSAGYLSRNMSMLSAAVRYCGTRHAPKIIHDPRTIAKLLRIAPPTAGKWFPREDDDLARFINSLKSELVFRWTMIALNTACRPEAAIDLGPDQIDLTYGLVDLNPSRRQQEPTKYRPILPLTECLSGWVQEWDARLQDIKSAEERAQLAAEVPWKLLPRYVPFRSVDSLQSTYTRIRKLEAVNMPQMVPYSIRNKMVTVLRMKQVPGSQRSKWLGHADHEESRTTSRSYGEFDPTYLRDAANATDEFMFELNKRTDRDLFAPSHCKSTAKDDILTFPADQARTKSTVIPIGRMVGATGIEPVTPTMST
jgi:integrase